MMIIINVTLLTSVTCLPCVSAVTLAVCFTQAWHSTFAVFAARQAAGVSCIQVLYITENTSETRLANAGVGVGVDWKAGTMNTPVCWRRETVQEIKLRMEKTLLVSFQYAAEPESHSLVSITGIANLLVTKSPCPPRMAGTGETLVTRWVAVPLDAGTSLARLAAWFHPVSQPLSVAPQSSWTWRALVMPGSQVLELSVDVEITEASMEAGAVTASGAELQCRKAARSWCLLWHSCTENRHRWI